MDKLSHTIIILFALLAVYTGCKKNCPIVVPVSVDAGIYDSVQLPGDTLTITGTVESGVTGSMKYLWTVVSGPGVPVFESDTSASTLIKGLVAGTYILQFQATNSAGITGLDTASIVVKPEPTPVTLTVQPVDNPYEIQLEDVNEQEFGAGVSPEIGLWAWTKNGAPYYAREVIKFDLSGIPANATILTAHLYLFSNPTPINGNGIDANYGADNSMGIQQITSSWSPSTIAWHNLPSITTANQVNVPATNSPFLDLDVDVKDMVASMVSQNANYGFYLKLNQENIYTDRDFVSSHNTRYPDKHPQLIVTYK
ncbi:MAG TPA: DNRLRE domain-containing protein [Chitinophagaceae bacterium]|nr:DNRLRE domain-containing protein [Chitinophagaceae bacterium]